MRSQEILERAREGDPRVIAAILNYTLKPLGVHVQGARRDRTLHLVLEADPLPEPGRMSTLITKLMRDLGGENLEQIVLYGQRVGEEPVAWKQELVLNIEPPLNSMTNPESEVIDPLLGDPTPALSEESPSEESLGSPSEPIDTITDEANPFILDPSVELLEPSPSEVTSFEAMPETEDVETFTAESNLFEETSESENNFIDPVLPELSFSGESQEAETENIENFSSESAFEETFELQSQSLDTPLSEFTPAEESLETEPSASFVAEADLFEAIPEASDESIDTLLSDIGSSEEMQDSETEAFELFSEDTTFEEAREAQDQSFDTLLSELPSFEDLQPEADESSTAELDLFETKLEPSGESLKSLGFEDISDDQELGLEDSELFPVEPNFFEEAPDSQGQSLDSLLPEVTISEGIQESDADESFTAELDFEDSLKPFNESLETFLPETTAEEVQATETEDVDLFAAELNFEEAPESQDQSLDALLQDTTPPEEMQESETEDTDPFTTDLNLFEETLEPSAESLESLLPEVEPSEGTQEPEALDSFTTELNLFESTLEPSAESLDTLLPEVEPSEATQATQSDTSLIEAFDFFEETLEPSAESLDTLLSEDTLLSGATPSEAVLESEPEDEASVVGIELFEEAVAPTVESLDFLSTETASSERIQESEPSATVSGSFEEIFEPSSEPVETLWSEAVFPDGVPETPPESIETLSFEEPPSEKMTEPIADIAAVTTPVPSPELPEPEIVSPSVAPVVLSEGEDDSIKALFKTLKRPEAVLLLFALVLVTFWEFYLDLAEGDSSEALTGISLAKRLQVSPSTISRRKLQEDFSAWSQSLDPEGISWIYQEGRFWPLESSIISN